MHFGLESLWIAGKIDFGVIQENRASRPREYSGAAIGIDVSEDGTFLCGDIEQVRVASFQLAVICGDRELAGEHGYVWQGKGRGAGEDHECCSVEPSPIAEGS